MLHELLFTPFSDPTHRQQYGQVRAALQAEADAPVTLLLGNFAVAEGGEALDAVVVRPHSITILVFAPGGGLLSVPSLSYGAWKLNGQPLAGSIVDADNPFEQFRLQKEALAAWLAPQFTPDQANLQFISGVVLFAQPVTFGPEVEEQLSTQPGGNFQLLADASQLPRRLRQLARPEIDFRDDDLTQWAGSLSEDSEEPEALPEQAAAPAAPKPAAPAGPWGKLWHWLGAHDIPEDTPYGGASDSQAAASSAEKQRLELMQQQTQAELRQQLQALEAREAERERSMARLQAQLSQVAPVTTEAQALREQLAAENQEKEALEEAIRRSRAESEARNQALDAKIQQLSQLIEQLHSRPAASAGSPSPASASPASAPTPASGSARPAPLFGPAGYRSLRAWRRRFPRAAAVLGLAGLLGLGAWGISRLTAGPPAPYQENGRWGFADESGQPVVPARYTSATPFHEERAVVEENGAYGMVDEDGKEVVPLAYDALNPYSEGYARVRVGDAYTFLDEQGQEFGSYYFNALDFSESYAAVLDHRGWHYISGPEDEDPAKPPIIFREAYAFRDGLARVRLANGYTFITPKFLADSTRGTKPFGRYDLATDFEQGKARVSQNGRSFFIDTDGDPVE